MNGCFFNWLSALKIRAKALRQLAVRKRRNFKRNEMLNVM